MNALIFNGQVVQIEADTFPVHDAFTWVPVPTGVNVAVGWSYANNTFTAPPTPPPLTLAQQAQTLLDGGLTVTSTSTPALNGIYACDSATLSYINSEMIAAGQGTFADGSTLIQWPDITGALHTFSIAEFASFAKAIGLFVSNCRKCIIGASTTLPSATANIA